MIVSQIHHPKLSPNSLSMAIVTFTNSRQVEFAVDCFNWGGERGVLFELLPIIHVLIGINSLSEQLSELFVHMTDSEIIEDRVNLQHPMTCTSAISACSMSDIVLINVGEFHFAFTSFTYHPIHPNQIPRE